MTAPHAPQEENTGTIPPGRCAGSYAVWQMKPRATILLDVSCFGAAIRLDISGFGAALVGKRINQRQYVSIACVVTITHRQKVAAHHRHRTPIPREHARSKSAELGILVFDLVFSHALLPSDLHLELEVRPSAGRRLTENFAVAGPNGERARRGTQADCCAFFSAKPTPMNSDQGIFTAVHRELLQQVPVRGSNARDFRRIILEQRSAARGAAVLRI